MIPCQLCIIGESVLTDVTNTFAANAKPLAVSSDKYFLLLCSLSPI